jgi:iron complex outermembrane recepter protein
MNGVRKSAFLAYCAYAAWGVSGAASAQQTAGTASVQQTPAGNALQEIVVTANKREEKLEDVGLTVTALSRQALAEQRVNSLQDIAAAVPGLSFSADTTNTPIFTLRGVGYNGNSLGAYPAVSLYIDQAPLPFPVLASHSAYDLERIEVLKGPQGTLFGENSTGGAINFIPARPTDYFEAGGDLTVGRFNETQENVYVSGPISSTVQSRLAVSALNADGWQYSYTRPYDTNGSQSNFASRLITDWAATEAVHFSLNLNGWVDTSQPQAPQFIALRSSDPATEYPAAAAYPFAPQNPRAADWATGDSTPRSDRHFYQAALRGDIKLTDTITLTSLTSYDDFRQTQATDVSGTSIAFENLPTDDGDIHSINQELRVAGSSTSMRWLVGGNFERSDIFENQITDYSQDSEDDAANLYIDTSGNTVQQDIKNIAGFANLEYDISPQFTVRGGARYTSSQDSATICGYSPGDGHVAELFNILGNLLGKVPFTPITGNECYTLNQNQVPGFPYVSTLKQDNVSWRGGLDFHANDDTLLYANVSRGYKAGSFPSLSAATYAQLQPVTQESVTAYEAGIKSEFMEHRAQLNGAAFYYDYLNKQIEGKENDPIFGPLNILVNVPKSRVYGMEGDLTVQPFLGMTLNASITYLQSKVQSYTGIDVLGNTENFAGDRLPFTPAWSGRINADYRFEIPDGGRPFVGMSVDGQTSSDTVIGGDNIVFPTGPGDRVLPGLSRVYQIDPYATVDARMGYETADGRWKVMLWGKNILNKYYWTNVYTSNDATARWAGMPATFGVTFTFKLK